MGEHSRLPAGRTPFAAAMAAVILSWPVASPAGHLATSGQGAQAGWWLGAGLGGARVRSLGPAPAAGRAAMDASLDFGYRFNRQLGLGFELGTLVPAGGCRDWNCAASPAQFAPTFTRMQAFGELRPPDGRWYVRAGVGVSKFCYSHRWSDSGWSWADSVHLALLWLADEPVDETISGTGATRCDARARAAGGTVAVGYDWPVSPRSPVSVGMRLSAEAANFGATPAIGVPAFRHRAVMLSLRVSVN